MAAMDAGKLIPLLYHPYTAISAIEGTYSDGCTKTEKYAICGKRVRFFLSVGGSTVHWWWQTLKQKKYTGYKRNDIHCYFYIKSWDYRWWPSRETDASATAG